MRSAMKWTLPLAAAAVALGIMSFKSAVAQPAAAKGTIAVTVKAADGTPAAGVALQLHKGTTVDFPARGGGGGGAPPASMPAALKEATADAQGAFKFEGLDAGDYTVLAGRAGGGGRRGQGGGAPADGAPAGPPPGPRGRGRATGAVKAGETLQLNIELQAGRGGGGGGGRGGNGGGGAPGGAGGGGRQGA